MFTKDDDKDEATQAAIDRAVAERTVEILLGGEQGQKVKDLLEAAEEAVMRAETPGEMQRVNRMVKSKIRALGNVAWLKENRT
jgi:predicted GTPase